jgi:hypothetical protein
MRVTRKTWPTSISSPAVILPSDVVGIKFP